MKRVKSELFIIVLGIAGFSVMVIHGSMEGIEPPSNTFLANISDIIVSCRVIEVSVETRRTIYEFEAIEAFKGTIEKKFTIKTPEGTNKITSPIPIRFEVGEEVLLYLKDNNGKFYVVFDYSGKKMLAIVDEALLESLRSEYIGGINNPDEYLWITFGILALIVLWIIYWIQQRIRI